MSWALKWWLPLRKRDVGVNVNASNSCFTAIRKANGKLGILTNSEGCNTESLWLLRVTSVRKIMEKGQAVQATRNILGNRFAKNAIMND